MKSIVLVSNPFGYGPSGKLASVVSELQRSGVGKKHLLVFVGSKFSWDIISRKGIDWIEVDERSAPQLKNVFRKLENPVVFSSQNRFAIEAAKDLGVPCAFLDGLAWFWEQIPAQHLAANIIFWLSYPGFSKPKISGADIRFVSSIVDEKAKVVKNRLYTLVHVGGCLNPLVPGLPEYWLKIIAETLREIKGRKIIVCGSKEALKFLRAQGVFSQNIKFLNLNHNKFYNLLSKASRLVTIGGQTASIEAMSLGVPVSFLPSWNFSQHALVENLRKEFAAPLRFDWDDLGLRSEYGTEKDAIKKYRILANKVYKDTWYLAETKEAIKRLITIPADFSGQTSFISKMGTGGAKQLSDHLVKKWHLN